MLEKSVSRPSNRKFSQMIEKKRLDKPQEGTLGSRTVSVYYIYGFDIFLTANWEYIKQKQQNIINLNNKKKTLSVFNMLTK